MKKQKKIIKEVTINSFDANEISIKKVTSINNNNNKVVFAYTRVSDALDKSCDKQLDEIIENLPNHITSGGAAVRYIRDELQRSASQERILEAWREIRKQN